MTGSVTALSPGILTSPKTSAATHSHAVYATHFPEGGARIHTIQKLLAQENVIATMIHIYVLLRRVVGADGPPGRL